MNKALHIKTTGEVRVLDFDSENEYKVIRDGVGGLIQPVTLENEIVFWCNEEGKMNGLPFNPLANRIFQHAFPGSRDYIVGDVVLTGWADEHGYSLGLTDEQIDEVTGYLVLTS